MYRTEMLNVYGHNDGTKTELKLVEVRRICYIFKYRKPYRQKPKQVTSNLTSKIGHAYLLRRDADAGLSPGYPAATCNGPMSCTYIPFKANILVLTLHTLRGSVCSTNNQAMLILIFDNAFCAYEFAWLRGLRLGYLCFQVHEQLWVYVCMKRSRCGTYDC